MYLLVLEKRNIYGNFNNLFDIDSRDNYAVTGLNKELNSLYIYNYFIKNKKIIWL